MGDELKAKNEEMIVKGKEMKAKDEETSPKRQRILETVILREEIRAPSFWDRLPYHVTVQVYSYLKNSDRSAMARVCRAWHTTFKDPSLWRSMEFTIGGPYTKQTDQIVFRFASIFWSGLQHVVIRYDHWATNSYKHNTETMEKLLGKLENARLYRLELLDLDLQFMFYHFPDLMDTVCGCLVKLLKTQTALKHVVFFNHGFGYLNRTEVLNALSESSGQTLESLHFNNSYLTFVDDFEVNTYQDIMTKFTNLREISVNYSYISEEILQRWTVDLKGKLQLLKITVWGNKTPGHVITSETWGDLSTACPQLQVELSIYQVSHADDIIKFLVPGMPLSGFCLRSNIKSARYYKLASALKHLADNFDKKLMSLNLILPLLRDSVENEIVRIVEKCHELIDIRVPASAAFGVATAIRNVFLEWQVQNVRLQAGITERYDKIYNAQQFEDIVNTFHEMLRNIPYLTVEFVDSLYIDPQDDLEI